MLGFWTDLPWWMRLIAGLAVTAGGIVIVVRCVHSGGPIGLLVDDVGKYQLLLGFAITGIGFGMLLVGGRSDAEKNGYKF